jgi:anti-anti-sigma regulatory factor
VGSAAVTTRIYPHTTVILLRGDVGEADAGRLRRALVETIMRRPRRIVVDLTNATALDPTAIGALLAVRDSAPDMDISLCVRRPSPALSADLAGHGLPILAARA